MIEFFGHRYRALEAECEVKKEEGNPIAPWQESTILLSLIITACIAFIAGVLGGPYLAPNNTDRYGFLEHYGDIIEIWHFNKTFAGKPDTTTEAAWRSIIPEGRGFITHPELAPSNKAISVFHQIHCLHALRVAYFKSVHEVRKSKNSSYTDPFLESIKPGGSPEHIQHCFDYIRQALMCAADTNLEHIDPRTNDTTGWGFERKCRNYWQVVRWAERWKNNGDHGIL